MYDKPSQFCQPPHKSRMSDSIIFKFWVDFCTTFVLATGWPTTRGVEAKAFDVHKSKAK